MINYKKHTLANGLRVIVHPDYSTPFAGINIIYDVGARDESPDQTGFAHLFEHLMFGGSKNIPDYDGPLQLVGGTNNAFTSNDITNYYLTTPASNIETGFWLESDRMLELDFSQKGLDVQKGVVCEEFRQNYINQPYGDLWHLQRELAYKVHPYMWPTIGKSVDHIEQATLENVKSFFYSHYAPNNAVLVIAGAVDPDEMFTMAERWFGSIPRRDVPMRSLPKEPTQKEFRELTVERDVPLDTFMWSWHMGDKLSDDYVYADLISDVLSCGSSSRLNQRLVHEKRLFIEIDAFISGESDPGLFSVIGKPAPGVDIDVAKRAIASEIEQISQEKVGSYELDKVKNKFEANLLYTETNYLDKAMHLAAYEVLQDASLVGEQLERYRAVTADNLLDFSQKIFIESNCSQLNYLSKKKS